MNKNVVIIGASGHGHVIADIVRANGDNMIGFLDDDLSKNVLGLVSDYTKNSNAEFIIGIGNAEIRERISEIPVKWYTAIHPSAIVSPSAEIGEGTTVMPNAVISADVIVGKHCIINSAAVVEHDNRIDDYTHISVGAKLGGNVNVGKKTLIGIGATVINNVTICDNCMIGAGAVVINNIEKHGKYIGIPAKVMKI